MFVETNTKDVLCDLQQNILVPFNTVHDEIDLIVDSFLSEGIAKRLSEIGAVKEIFDKIGINFINYIYDMEFDEEGSFIPRNSYNIYETPSNEIEDEFMNKMKESEPDIEKVTLKLDTLKDIKKELKYSVNGIRVDCILPNGKTVSPKRLVDKDSISKYIEEFSV